MGHILVLRENGEKHQVHDLHILWYHTQQYVPGFPSPVVIRVGLNIPQLLFFAIFLWCRTEGQEHVELRHHPALRMFFAGQNLGHYGGILGTNVKHPTQ